MRFVRAFAATGLVVLLLGADNPRPEWSTDLEKMVYPDAAVSGRVMGADFKLDKVNLVASGALTLQQGKDVFGDASIIIFLPVKSPGEAAGKSFKLGAEKVEGEKRLSIHMKRRPTPKELPQGTAYLDGYALKLEFGTEKDGKVPGKIYLCMPDDGKSVIAGTFTLDIK
jgi:hypothetical protein